MFKKFIENRKKARNERINYYKNLSALKETTKINLQELISDLRFYKPNFWNRMRAKFFGSKLVMCEIHYPDNVDVIRYFPMIKPFLLDINNKKYLFSPKAFRFINNIPKLEFYANVPFAVVHDVNKNYTPPSLDADAFTSVQDSKFIQDAATVGEDNNLGWINWVLLIVLVVILIMTIINTTNINHILKAFPK